MIETTRKIRREEEWDEFWYECFYGEESLEDGWKNDEKRRHRENRRFNRMHKKRLVNINRPVIEARIDRVIRHERLFDVPREEVKVKRYSLYRLRDNGKNYSPSKPIPRREKNFFLKMISDLESYQSNFEDKSDDVIEKKQTEMKEK